MIRPATPADTITIHAIINEAAQAYKGVIPDDCWHEPYMSEASLAHEIDSGVVFSVWDDGGEVLGVMGLQPVRDVALIRHAYVRQGVQRRGIGAALLADCCDRTDRRLLVGTWADARWAIRFYERHGFQLVAPEDTDRLLQRYWDVPERQRRVSVVLEHRRAPHRIER